MVEPADRSSTAGQRLGAPDSFGVSTLEPGLRPPTQPPGRQVSIRVQMLDDTQEVFQISVSQICRWAWLGVLMRYSQSLCNLSAVSVSYLLSPLPEDTQEVEEKPDSCPNTPHLQTQTLPRRQKQTLELFLASVCVFYFVLHPCHYPHAPLLS